jgi:nucleoside-diphosphate-sugar epimerase
MKILVTGASGFVGNFLLAALRDAGHEVRAASRSRVEQQGIDYVLAPELGPDADWGHALLGVDAVVHLAGRAHVPSKNADAETEEIYFRINTEGTRALAEQAAAAGVKQFVFLSSCHAVAAESGEILNAETTPRPVSAYGRSKLEAERAAREALLNKACAWTILRPPLVYGRGNKANFGLLLKLVSSGIPLPLALVQNRRSFIYLENLVDVIVACLGNPKAFGKTYLPSDGEDVSTPELIRKIAKSNKSFQFSAPRRLGAVGKELTTEDTENTEVLHHVYNNHETCCLGYANRENSHSLPATSNSSLATLRAARLFPFPESILKALGRLPGLGALRKLTSSLYVDSEPLREDLGWSPRFTIDDGLIKTLVG